MTLDRDTIVNNITQGGEITAESESHKKIAQAESVYSKDMFKKAPQDLRDAETIKRPTIKYWADVWRRLKQNKLAMIGLILLIVMGIMSFAGVAISDYTYNEQNYSMINQGPSSEYWFGTDELGRDLFSRAWLGTRYSLIIGLLAAAVDFGIGVIYGGVSGMDFIKMAKSYLIMKI